MEQTELEILIGDVEVSIERLRSLYDQYFMGIEKIEPAVARKDVDRRIYVLRKEHIRNTALRFRFQMVLQRYNTFQSHWQRICREIENGTYKRHVFRAEQRFGKPGAKGLSNRAPPPESAAPSPAPRAKPEPGADLPPDLAAELAELDKEFAPAPAQDTVLLEAARRGAAARSPGGGPRAEPMAPLSLGETMPPLRAPVASGAAQPGGRPPPPPGSTMLPGRGAGASTAGAPGGPPPLASGSLMPSMPSRIAAGPRAPQPPGQPPALPSQRPAGQPTGQGGPPRPPPAPSTGAGATPTMVRPPPAPPLSPALTKPAPAAPRPLGTSAPAAVPPPRPLSTPIPAAPRPLGTPTPPAPAPPAPLSVPTPPIASAKIAPVPPPARERPHPAPPPAAPRDDGLPENRVRQLYSQFVEAKRRQNESTAAITYDLVAQTLRDASARLRQKHGKPVDFEIAIRDGKAFLKPVLK